MSIRTGAVLALALTVGIVVTACKREALQGGAPPSPVHDAPLQAFCPVMRGPVDTSIYMDYEGRRVYFCCPQCREEFARDPGKYEKNLPSEPSAERSAPGGAGAGRTT
jgi:YHS domain-containing protein